VLTSFSCVLVEVVTVQYPVLKRKPTSLYWQEIPHYDTHY
jgi:hypothetical protein